MYEFVESGSIVDMVIALVLIEGVALVALRSIIGRGPGRLDIICNLAAGLALMMALRDALAEKSMAAIALWLTLSLVAHLLDLWLRWRSALSPGVKKEG